MRFFSNVFTFFLSLELQGLKYLHFLNLMKIWISHEYKPTKM